METASSTIMNTLPIPTMAAKLYRIHRKDLFSRSYLPLTTPRTSGLRSRRARFNGSFSSNTQENLSHQGPYGYLSFWQSSSIQYRKSFGEEERMLILYFNRIGWPTSLPTREKETFLKRVLWEKIALCFPNHINALDDLVISKTSPLRPGVEDFIDDALEESIPVVMLTACSKREEKMARSIIEKLGSHRVSKMKIIGDEEVKQSLYGQLVLSKGVSSDLGEKLAKEVNKAVSAEEQRIAKEVASMLKLSVDINTASSECFESIVAALRAGAEYAETPVDKCILVAGSQSGVSAAERIGMPRVVVRNSLTARAEFPGANAVMDGFGGADLTISRLRQMQNL